MTISKKPKTKDVQQADIDALINKGGSPAGSPEPSNTPVSVLLKIPAEMLEKVDRSAKSRPVKIPRRTWILEAIHEKLCREGERNL